MERDLTVGNPLKVLLRYVLPLFGSIIFQQLYNIADSFIAGRYIGTEALAAVGNSYEITLIYIAFAFGCNVGVSVIVAKYFGAKKTAKVKTAVSTAFISALVFGTFLTALGLALVRPLLSVINTPSNIFASSADYLYIYIGGYLFLLLYNIATGIFSAIGDSKTPFIMLVISSVCNVIMDIVFVKYCGMGVSGVAWATFMCQGASGVVAISLALVKIKKLKPQEVQEDAPQGILYDDQFKGKVFDFAIFKEICIVAIPSIVQQSCVSIGNLFIQSFINAFGTAAIGGYAAAVKMNNLTVTSLVAIGNGISNYSAQNLGANKVERIKKGFWCGYLLAGILSVVFLVIYLTCGKELVNLFITDGNTEAVSIGAKYLTIISPFYPLITFKVIIDGILRGTGRMWGFTTSTLTDLVIRVVLSAILDDYMGVTGIWWSWPIGWAVATVLSLCLYAYAYKRNFKTKLFN